MSATTRANAVDSVHAAVPDAPINSDPAPGDTGFTVHRVGVPGVEKDPRFTTDAGGNFTRGVVWIGGVPFQYSDLAAFVAAVLLVGAL